MDDRHDALVIVLHHAVADATSTEVVVRELGQAYEAHPQGWLDHVIVPLANERPDLLAEVAVGVLRRLDQALRVCDRALRELDSAG